MNPPTITDNRIEIDWPHYLAEIVWTGSESELKSCLLLNVGVLRGLNCNECMASFSGGLQYQWKMDFAKENRGSSHAERCQRTAVSDCVAKGILEISYREDTGLHSRKITLLLVGQELILNIMHPFKWHSCFFLYMCT